jgi:hypothetical protein
MSPNRHLRKGIFWTGWSATIFALAMLSSLLVAPKVPLEFPQATSVRQCSVSTGSTHGQASRFDSDGLQWAAPLSTSVILPCAAQANSTLTQQLFPAIEVKGFHFNRPPPTH